MIGTHDWRFVRLEIGAENLYVCAGCKKSGHARVVRDLVVGPCEQPSRILRHMLANQVARIVAAHGPQAAVETLAKQIDDELFRLQSEVARAYSDCKHCNGPCLLLPH